jgi:hypothetical protein
VVAQGEAAAGFSQLERQRPPDAGGGAGDDGYFVLESLHFVGFVVLRFYPP